MIKATPSNLPRGWQIDSISNLTNNLDNRRIPLNQEQRSEKEGKGSYPYVGANNIVGYIDEYLFDEKILCIAEDGGSWGYNETCAFIMNEKCWVNNHAHVLTAKENLVIEYLKYYLNYADLNLHINGATRGKLNQSALNKIEIPLPPLAEQQKIAAILDAADSLRQKDQQLVERYTALSQSLFLEMFGDPVTNPMGWDKKRLFELTNMITDGKHGDCQNENGSGYFFISAKDISNQLINYSNAREILQKDFEEVHRRTDLRVGDLVMVNTGATIGKVAIATDLEKTEKTTFQKSVAVIKPNKELLSSVFLKYVFLLRIESYSSKGSGSAVKNLLLSEMRRFEIIAPDLNLQNQFAERIQLIEAQKQQAQKSLAKSEALFNSMLQRTFTGELTAKMAA